MVRVVLYMSVVVLLLAIHVGIFKAVPAIQVIEIIAPSQGSRGQDQYRAAITTGNSSPAVVAHRAQGLLLLVFQVAAYVGIAAAAVAVFALIEFFSLLCFHIVDLTVQLTVHLFAWITGPRRWAGRKRKQERQEGKNGDGARGPRLTHRCCLLDTRHLSRCNVQAVVLFCEV